MLNKRLIRSHHASLTSYLILTFVTLYFYGGLLTAVPLETHETPYLYYRIFEYIAEFRSFGFPPAVFPDAMQQGGFAFPLFYPPLSYYVGALLGVVLNNIYLAGNAALFLSVLLSSYAAYYGFSRISDSWSAVLGAVVYITQPYRFVDCMVRGALGECWTFVWFPLIFCGGVLILNGSNRKGCILISVGAACLVLTHAVMAMYFIAICVLIFLFVCLMTMRFTPALYGLLSFCLAGALSAWYVIPQRVLWSSIKASNAEYMWANLNDVVKHATNFSQFFYSDPSRWVNGSTKGVLADGMSFELGLANVLLLFMLLALFTLDKYKPHPQNRNQTYLLWATIAFWVICIMFMLDPEVFLSHLPQQFMFVQFGWRLLGIVGFLCAASYVFMLSSVQCSPFYKWGMVLLGVILVLQVNPNNKIVYYDKGDVVVPITLNKIIAAGNAGYVHLGEYLPNEFKEHERKRLASKTPTFIGDMVIADFDITPKQMTARVVARTSSTILLPRVAYPVYQARTQDGRILERGSYNGLLTFSGIQPGDTIINVTRIRPISQKIGLAISSAAAVALLALLFMPAWKLRKKM